MIIEHIDSVDDLPWAPTVKSLEKRLESTLALLIQFFRMHLTTGDTHHTITESIKKVAESLSQDLCYFKELFFLPSAYSTGSWFA